MRANDFKQCFFDGKKAEEKFSELAESKGYEVTSASKTDDMRKHVDVWIKKDGGEKIGVDVKSKKKVSRNDGENSGETIWLELVNVTGNVGWVFGDSNLVSFETEDGFLLVNRRSLADFALQWIDFDDVVSQSKDSLYKSYTRSGRKDVISRVNVSDLVENTWNKVWEFNQET